MSSTPTESTPLTTPHSSLSSSSYWALVPAGEATIPPPRREEEEEKTDFPLLLLQESAKEEVHRRLRVDITGIYEYYAALYPNPSLVPTSKEPYLPTQSNGTTASKTSDAGGFWNFWSFGRGQRGGGSLPQPQQAGDDSRSFQDSVVDANDGLQSLSALDQQPSPYGHGGDHGDEAAVGLDGNCIPLEAHALARLCLASQHRRRLNPCRQTSSATELVEDVEASSSSFSSSCNSLIFLIGLGQVMEILPTTTKTETHSEGDNNHIHPKLHNDNSINDGGHLQYTSDHDALHDHIQRQGVMFRLEYARGVLIDNHLLIVSWGLPDGIVQIYRRSRGSSSGRRHTTTTSKKKKNNNNKNQQQHHSVIWQCVATCSPTHAVVVNDMVMAVPPAQSSSSSFSSSAMWLVSDLLPLVLRKSLPPKEVCYPPPPPSVDPPSDDASVVILTIARLGGSLELVPLPLPLLSRNNDEEADTPPVLSGYPLFYPGMLSREQKFSSSKQEQHNRNNNNNNKKNHKSRFFTSSHNDHYAMGLPNLSHSASVLTVTDSWHYHSNLLSLSAFVTSRHGGFSQQQQQQQAAATEDWNPELYPHHPPAEYVLILNGGGNASYDGSTKNTNNNNKTNSERLSFWSVCTRVPQCTGSAVLPQEDGNKVGFSLHCVAIETLDVMGSSSLLTSSSLGPDWTVFATKAILRNWQRVQGNNSTSQNQAKRVRQEEGNNLTEEAAMVARGGGGEGNNQDHTHLSSSSSPLTATAISVPRPIVDVQCCRVAGSGVLLVAILDANGGVTCVDCARLERLAAHNLAPEEYERMLVQKDDDDDKDHGNKLYIPRKGVSPVPSQLTPLSLVSVLADRAQIQALLGNGLLGNGQEEQQAPCHVHALSVIPPGALSAIVGSDLTLSSANMPVLALVTETHHLVLCSLTDVIGKSGNRSPLAVMLLEEHKATTVLSQKGLQLVFCDDSVNGMSGFGLRVACLQELRPADIVQTLEDQGKLPEALQAANQLMVDLQSTTGAENDNLATIQRLSETVDRIKQLMWLNYGDWTALHSVSDDNFVVHQALQACDQATESLETEQNWFVDLDDLRSILQLGLERLDRAVVTASDDTMDVHQDKARSKILRRLILLGTYRLLGRLVGDHGDGKNSGDNDIQLSSSHFFTSFVPNFSVEDLASRLAENGDIAGLSLLLLRHWEELMMGNDFDWLLRIPPTLPLSLYSHCIPVVHKRSATEEESTLWFLKCNDEESLEGEPMLVAVENIPDLLLQKFGVQTVMDEVDRKTVMDSVLKSAKFADWTVLSSLLEQVYVSRIRSIQSFTGSLDYAHEFSRAALFALGDRLRGESSESPPIDKSETLFYVHERIRMLKSILRSHPAGIGRLPPSALTLTLESLNTNALPGLLSIAYNAGQTREDIMHMLNALRPLMSRNLTGQNNEDEEGGAFVSWCLDLVQSAGASASSTGASGIFEHRNCEQLLLDSLNICTALALLSRTSLSVQDRFIGNKYLLGEFVVKVVKAVFRMLLSTDIEGKVNLANLFDSFWCLYESLPVAIGSREDIHGDHDVSKDPLMVSADDLNCVLASLEISVAWHDEASQTLCLQSYIDGKGRDVSVAETVVSSLCSSFCSQLFSASATPDFMNSSELLRSLISDTQELVTMYKTSKTAVCLIVARDLFVPILKARDMNHLAFLLKHGGEILDAQFASRAIVSFTNEEVNSSREREPDVEFMAACWDAIGEYFPDLEAHFITIQGYLNTVECLNSFPFQGREMFTAADVKELESIEVIELLLSECPNCVVYENDEWADPSSAAILNNAIREITVDERENHLSPREVSQHLPRLPGQAVFQLAENLGLVNEEQVVNVKSRVAFHALAGGFHGASAAICRDLLLTDLELSKNRTVETEKTVLRAVCATVLCNGYEDMATKRELCGIVLSFPWDRNSVVTSHEYEQVLNGWVSTEYNAVLSIDVKSELRCFQRETLVQHSVNIAKLLNLLFQRGRDCVHDDELLGALSRYAISWCAAGVFDTSGGMDWAGEGRLSTIGQTGLSLLHHIRDKDLLQRSIDQMIESLETQLASEGGDDEADMTETVADEELVRHLQQCGYTRNASIRAATSCSGAGFDEALAWAVKHSYDPNVNQPIVILKNDARKLSALNRTNLRHLLQLLEATKMTSRDSKIVSSANLEHLSSSKLGTGMPDHGTSDASHVPQLEQPQELQQAMPPKQQGTETGSERPARRARTRHSKDTHLSPGAALNNPEDAKPSVQPSFQASAPPSRGLVRRETGDSTDLAAMRGATRRGRRNRASVETEQLKSSSQQEESARPSEEVVGEIRDLSSVHRIVRGHLESKHAEQEQSTTRAEIVADQRPSRRAGTRSNNDRLLIPGAVQDSAKTSVQPSSDVSAPPSRGLVRRETGDSTDLAAMRGATRRGRRNRAPAETGQQQAPLQQMAMTELGREVVSTDLGECSELPAMKKPDEDRLLSREGNQPQSQSPLHVADLPSRGIVRRETGDSTDLAAMRGGPRRRGRRGGSTKTDEEQQLTTPEQVTGLPPSDIISKSPDQEQEFERRPLMRNDTADSMDVAFGRGSASRHISHAGEVSGEERHQPPHQLLRRDDASKLLIRMDTADSTSLAGSHAAHRHNSIQSDVRSSEAEKDGQQHLDSLNLKEGDKSTVLPRQEEQQEPTVVRPTRRAGRRPQRRTEQKYEGAPLDRSGPSAENLTTQVSTETSPRLCRVDENDSESEVSSSKTPAMNTQEPSTHSTDAHQQKKSALGDPLLGAEQTSTVESSALSEGTIFRRSNPLRRSDILRAPGVTKSEQDPNPMATFVENSDSYVGNYLGSSFSKTLKRASPVKSPAKLSPSERTSFRQRGQEFLHQVKGSGNPSNGERQRLIERGREFFLQSRSQAPVSIRPANGIAVPCVATGQQQVMNKQSTLNVIGAASSPEAGKSNQSLDSVTTKPAPPEPSTRELAGTCGVKMNTQETSKFHQDKNGKAEREITLSVDDTVGPYRQQSGHDLLKPAVAPQQSSIDGRWKYDENENGEHINGSPVESSLVGAKSWASAKIQDPDEKNDINDLDDTNQSLLPDSAKADLTQSSLAAASPASCSQPSNNGVLEPSASEPSVEDDGWEFDEIDELQEQEVSVEETPAARIPSPVALSLPGMASERKNNLRRPEEGWKFDENEADDTDHQKVPSDVPGSHSNDESGWDFEDDSEIVETEQPGMTFSPIQQSSAKLAMTDAPESVLETVASGTGDDGGWDFEDDIDI